MPEIASVNNLGLLWERLPLVLLFAGGYVTYRFMAATRVTDVFVSQTVLRSRGRPVHIILYILIASAMLSAFIPNAVTVLTLLPVLTLLDRSFREQGVKCMTTPLMVSAIYGAGIGGMASMIGTPANAILLVALEVLQVPGREHITFLNWFVWSVPLVIMFLGAAWFVAGFLGVPAAIRKTRLNVDCALNGKDNGCRPDGGMTARQAYGVRLLGLFLAYWVAEAVVRALVPAFAAWSPGVSLIFSLVYMALVFARSAPESAAGSGPLLRPVDIVTGVPRRGLAFVLLLGVVFAVARVTGLEHAASVWVGHRLSLPMPAVAVFFLTVVSVIFLTEVLSNTVVVAGFFTIVHLAATSQSMDPLPLMIAVSVASTCAFMTPIATPSNALAFGEMRGASLRGMLVLGAILNILGALIMTGWLSWVLPLIYS